MTRASISDQKGGVSAGFSINLDVVTEGRSLPLDRGREHLSDSGVQPFGARRADPARSRVDASEPQRLVGIDVAHSRDRPLGQQERLDGRPSAGKGRGENRQTELLRQGFRAQSGKRGNRPVVPLVDDCQAPEPAYVPERQRVRVVEIKPCAHVGVKGMFEAKLAGHSKVHDQLEVAIEGRDEELAAPCDLRDGPAGKDVETNKLARD